MYSIAGFGDMIVDAVRLDAYAEALRRHVKPDCVVVDIGAGTGILSLLACKLGARRVYAIEPSDAAALILETSRDNGCGELITVLQQRSTEVELPERADVIVSDLRGVLPPFHRHFTDIADARARLLGDNGVLIPRADRIFAAVVSAPAVFEERRKPWTSDPYGLVLRAALRHVDNSWQKFRAEPDALLSPPIEWAHIDYRKVEGARIRGHGTLHISKDGDAHGLLAWFDAELSTGIGFSNHPRAPRAIYGQALFHWPQAVALRAGDQVEFELRADPNADGYVWTWSSTVRTRAAPEIVAHRFRQSEFLGAPLSPDRLRRQSSRFAPQLSPAGEHALHVLECFRSGEELGVLAQQLLDAYPGEFCSFEAALDFVSDLSLRYSR
jgi:protein arginine N-methyltransferase 1